jgi:integrase
MARLGEATHRQRENIMVHVLAAIGDKPYVSIRRQDIVASRDARSATPSQARNFLDCMRGMFRWALDAEHIKVDPTAGVANPKKPKTDGFPAWNENDVEAYQKRWPLGTKERVWLDLLLYTGPRRGDVCRLGRQHVRKVFDPELQAWIEVISFKTEKGGNLIEVNIPILPILRATLDAGPCGDLAFIVGERGHPYTKESFGNVFSAAAREAGVPKSAHGVRKIAATTAADNGATVHQLMSIFGWKTTQMAEVYTRAADRKRLARGAMHMLGRTVVEHSMCQPEGKVGTLALKSD